MTRVYAVVEGDTELDLLTKVVAPALLERGVYLLPMKVLIAGGGRGGGTSWTAYKRHVEQLIATHRSTDIRFTTMLDLYRIPKDTPGWLPQGATNGAARANAMLGAIHASVASPRFIPYIQVHEVEALALAGLGEFRTLLPDRIVEDHFAEIERAAGTKEPEHINDGPETAPSKRLMRGVRGYNKRVDGVEVMLRTGLATLRERCPRFGAWVTTLESLGTACAP